MWRVIHISNTAVVHKFTLEEQTWMKRCLPTLKFHLSFPAEWTQVARLHTSPKRKTSRRAPALWPSPHCRVLPLVLPWLQLNVVLHVLSPIEPHCHKDNKEEQDDTTSASNRRCQDANLREGGWKKKKQDPISVLTVGESWMLPVGEFDRNTIRMKNKSCSSD